MRSFGIDISVWQTDSAKNPTRFFDGNVAAEKDVKYCFMRASSNTVKDKAVDKFVESFSNAGVPFGFYHFAYTYSTYSRQVDVFWDTIKDYPQALPPVLDLEYSGLSLDFAQAFLGRLGDKSGRTPIVYTSSGFWNSIPNSSKATWVLQYPLWVANYKSVFTFPTYGNPEIVDSGVSNPSVPNVWKLTNTPWTFWQYCCVGDGEFYGGNYAHSVNEVGLDMNAFNGTTEQLYKRFEIKNTGTPAEPVEPTSPDKKEYVKTTGYLRGRTVPEYIAGDSALIYRPDTVLEKADMKEEYEDASGITWTPVVMYVSKKYVTSIK